MILSWPMTLNWANPSPPHSLIMSVQVPTRALYFTQQELELIALSVDSMTEESNYQCIKAIASPEDLAAFNTLVERVRRW